MNEALVYFEVPPHCRIEASIDKTIDKINSKEDLIYVFIDWDGKLIYCRENSRRYVYYSSVNSFCTMVGVYRAGVKRAELSEDIYATYDELYRKAQQG